MASTLESWWWNTTGADTVAALGSFATANAHYVLLLLMLIASSFGTSHVILQLLIGPLCSNAAVLI